MKVTDILPAIRPLRQVEAFTQWPRIRVTWQTEARLDLAAQKPWHSD